MTPAQIRDKMDSLKNYIQEAEASVRNGKMVDLTGLDKEIAQICQKAVTLPPDQARDIQPLMAGLIGDLEQLSRTLHDFKDQMKK